MEKFMDFWHKIWWIRKALIHLIGACVYTYLILVVATSPIGLDVANSKEYMVNWEEVYKQLFPMGSLLWLLVRVARSFDKNGFNVSKL